jgi:hypothetical protein
LGTPTQQHISFLCLVLRLPSQSFFCLHTAPCTDSDNSRLTITAMLPLSNSSLCSTLQNQAPLPITAKRSLAASISVSDHPSLTCQSTLMALARRPFYVPQTMGIDAASHTYQLCQLANGKAEQTAELSIKEASFPSSEHSRFTTQADTSRRMKRRLTAWPRCCVD